MSARRCVFFMRETTVVRAGITRPVKRGRPKPSPSWRDPPTPGRCRADAKTRPSPPPCEHFNVKDGLAEGAFKRSGVLSSASRHRASFVLDPATIVVTRPNATIHRVPRRENHNEIASFKPELLFLLTLYFSERTKGILSSALRNTDILYYT